MDPATLAIVVPALVEITREILGLFRTRRTNLGRRRAAERFIRERFPEVKDHLANLLIELCVTAHKEGLSEELTVKYIEGFLHWHAVWPKPERS